VVDEQANWLAAAGRPTHGEEVEMAVAVIVGFKDGKISHEHIYRDQGGVLAQVGLLDPAGLPVVIRCTRRLERVTGKNRHWGVDVFGT
jgi:hypothetical protein